MHQIRHAGYGGDAPRKQNNAVMDVSTLADGNTIDPQQYQRIRQLGAGSHGRCYVVRDSNSNESFVMKEVDLDDRDPKMLFDAVNESTILCTLHHPNIIRYKGSSLCDSNHPPHARRLGAVDGGKIHPPSTRFNKRILSILMEHAKGGDLFHRVSRQKGRGAFPEVQVTDWFIQLLFALRHMHKRYILHRDLKSQNIFLTNDGVVKLGDFGISRILDHTLQNAHSFVGTPYYLSPELIQGKPYNGSSDMWSLGVVLGELMLLQPPFPGRDMDSLSRAILSGRHLTPSSVAFSLELRGIFLSLLKQDPRARPDAHRLLHHPYIKGRIQEWYTPEPDAQYGLRPVPPAWYLKELRKQGHLEDLLPPTLEIGAADSTTPLVPSLAVRRGHDPHHLMGHNHELKVSHAAHAVATVGAPKEAPLSRRFRHSDKEEGTTTGTTLGDDVTPPVSTKPASTVLPQIDDNRFHIHHYRMSALEEKKPSVRHLQPPVHDVPKKEHGLWEGVCLLPDVKPDRKRTGRRHFAKYY